MTPDLDMEKVELHVARLMEHFDTVRIFCTRQDSDGQGLTEAFTSGAGNFYAQKGQVREWLEAGEEEVRETVRGRTE